MGICCSTTVIPDGYDENSTSMSTFKRQWQVTPSADEARSKYIADGTIPLKASEFDVELRELLGDPIASHYIHNHLNSLGAVEIFNCWIDILEYKLLPSDKNRHGKAAQIYIKYFVTPETSEEKYKSIFTDNFKKKYADSIKENIADEIYTERYFHDLQISCFVFMSDKFVDFKVSNKYFELTKVLKRKYNRVKASDFEYVKCLGEGGFGIVVHVRKKSTNTNYAMKMQTKEGLYASAHETPWRIDFEKQAFAASKHPFIIELEYAFHSRSLTYLVMELGDAGDLSQSLKECPDKKMAYERVRFYAAEISCVLAYIHQKGLIYRDLKPNNILLNADGHIKLVDFGAVVDVHGKTLTICDKDHFSSPLFAMKQNVEVEMEEIGSGYRERAATGPSFINNEQSMNIDGVSHNTDENPESDMNQSVTPPLDVSDKLAQAPNSVTIDPTDLPPDKLDRAMSVIGTMGYMAPEMVVIRMLWIGGVSV